MSDDTPLWDVAVIGAGFAFSAMSALGDELAGTTSPFQVMLVAGCCQLSLSVVALAVQRRPVYAVLFPPEDAATAAFVGAASTADDTERLLAVPAPADAGVNPLASAASTPATTLGAAPPSVPPPAGCPSAFSTTTAAAFVEALEASAELAKSHCEGAESTLATVAAVAAKPLPLSGFVLGPLTGLAAATANCSFFFAAQWLPHVTAYALWCCNPCFVVFLARVLNNEAFTWVRLVSAFTFVVGVFFLTNAVGAISGQADTVCASNTHGDEGTNATAASCEPVPERLLWIGRALAFFGAAGFSALRVTLLRRLSQGASFDPWAAVFWQGTFALLLGAAGSLVMPTTSLRGTLWAFAAAFGLCLCLGNYLVGVALRTENAALVGVLWNMSVAYAFLWAYFFFHQTIYWYHYVGVGIVIAAGALSSLETYLVGAPDLHEDAADAGDAGASELGAVLPAGDPVTTLPPSDATTPAAAGDVVIESVHGTPRAAHLLPAVDGVPPAFLISS